MANGQNTKPAPVSMQFKMSEERLQALGQEFLMIGQQHKLQPWELCITLGLVKEWLEKELGLEITEQKVIDG